MSLSLRTRLTAWYSVLLVLTVVVFSAAVLWLHWRLLIEQFDDNLKAVSSTAINVVEEELGEVHDLGHAAAEMTAVVRPPDDVVQVLDVSGVPIHKTAEADAAAARGALARIHAHRPRTITAPDGMPWRVTRAPGDGAGLQVLRRGRRAARRGDRAMEHAAARLPDRHPAGAGVRRRRRALARTARAPPADRDGRGGAGDHREDARPAPDRAAVRGGARAARGVVQHACWIGWAARSRRSAGSWPTRRTSCGRRCRSCAPPPT